MHTTDDEPGEGNMTASRDPPALTRVTGSSLIAWAWVHCVMPARADPGLLAVFHSQLDSVDGSLGLAVGALIVAVGVSALGLLGAFVSGRRGVQRPRVRVARRISHLVTAAPPLFVFMGV